VDDTNQLFWTVTIVVGAIVLWRLLWLFRELLGTIGEMLGGNRADDAVQRMLDELDENSKPRARTTNRRF
jgi:hypothetical protein